MTDHSNQPGATSRLSGLFRDDVATRRRRVEDALGLATGSLDGLDPGFSIEAADQLTENVLGLFQLPFSVATNFQIDGVDRLIPMVVEEPSVVAAASHAAKMARAGGGFTTAATDPVTVAQVELRSVPDIGAAVRRITAAAPSIGETCDQLKPRLKARGGGFRGLDCRPLADGTTLVVHLKVDCRDAMGANAVNTIAEAVSDELAQLSGGRTGLRILSNLADTRLASAECRIPPDALARGGLSGEEVRDGVVAAYRFAALDPYRAATHNKGLMNGVDAVVMATANDWRAVEAGAHAYAARSGAYGPLSTWSVGESGDLRGRAELPLAVGIVGGATRVHPVARLAIEMMGIERSTDLARIAVAVGLAQNLGAMSALAAEGIQQGHMALHERSRDLQK